jgi:hypothetical protein
MSDSIRPYEPLTSENAALVLIDHQVGLRQVNGAGRFIGDLAYPAGLGAGPRPPPWAGRRRS